MTSPITEAVSRAKWTEAEADALSALAHIAVTTTPTLSIHRSHASALLAYMRRLETERSELRSAQTAAEKLTHEERLRVARMLREHALAQRKLAKEMDEANPGDNYAGLANDDEADDACALAAKVEA